MLNVLNLCNVTCQLYFSKTEGKKFKAEDYIMAIGFIFLFVFTKDYFIFFSGFFQLLSPWYLRLSKVSRAKDAAFPPPGNLGMFLFLMII